MMKIPVEFLSMSTKQRRGSLEGQSHGKVRYIPTIGFIENAHVSTSRLKFYD